jgi:hypothetical protein
MNYDDYKLATPPDFDNETVYEYCDHCDNQFESDELNNVLIDLVPFTLCKNCKNLAEINNLNPKNPNTMKTAKERFEAMKFLIDNNMIPEGCEVRLWINNCTKKEILNLSAELGIPSDKRNHNDSRLFLLVEFDNHEITLWE